MSDWNVLLICLSIVACAPTTMLLLWFVHQWKADLATPLRSFATRWPPISDDEFLEKCTPGTRRETAVKVRRIISEQLGIDYYRIHPEQHFFEDLDCC